MNKEKVQIHPVQAFQAFQALDSVDCVAQPVHPCQPFQAKSKVQLVKSASQLILIYVIHQVGVIVQVRATLQAVQDEKFLVIIVLLLQVIVRSASACTPSAQVHQNNLVATFVISITGLSKLGAEVAQLLVNTFVAAHKANSVVTQLQFV